MEYLEFILILMCVQTNSVLRRLGVGSPLILEGREMEECNKTIAMNNVHLTRIYFIFTFVGLGGFFPQTKEERIVVLETENAALHLKLAEVTIVYFSKRNSYENRKKDTEICLPIFKFCTLYLLGKSMKGLRLSVLGIFGGGFFISNNNTTIK